MAAKTAAAEKAQSDAEAATVAAQEAQTDAVTAKAAHDARVAQIAALITQPIT